MVILYLYQCKKGLKSKLINPWVKYLLILFIRFLYYNLVLHV